jgi:tRNA threonylcarbamoyl adenosine modification protein YeaZ
MKLLAFEFSSPQRSVAVADVTAAGPALALSEVVDTGAYSTRALGMADEALRQAGLEREQIECLAVGLGPGSYTGIRVAIAVAQGWQLVTNVKLLGISTADCLAAQARHNGITGQVAVVIDAQRGEFYLANYEIAPSGCSARQPLRLASLAEVQACRHAGQLLVGPEVTNWFAAGRRLFPAAATLAGLVAARHDFTAGERLEPIYLRETKFVKTPPRRGGIPEPAG